ncbi:protein LURP-one-related 5-like isoform X1 [Primulina huaijiensis]|uniref:protein LURP-one-related 5-like isoform X1 n=1 Tax=Primulina huaijiensis TaxID=1492673 RepID=UPI003CC73F65
MKMESHDHGASSGFVFGEETHFTVLKTSNFFAGDGFCAYDAKGKLVFRVDSYGPGAKNTGEVVLMDADGTCLLTVRRKQRPSLHHRWDGFTGERTDGQKPLFSVRKSSILGHSSTTVEMYNKVGEEYQIVGSFAGRSCTVLGADKKAVAEIRRKVDASSSVVLGKEVFWLSLKAGVDVAFVMGLVLVLDRIQGDDEYEAARRAGVDAMKEHFRISS